MISLTLGVTPAIVNVRYSEGLPFRMSPFPKVNRIWLNLIRNGRLLEELVDHVIFIWCLSQNFWTLLKGLVCTFPGITWPRLRDVIIDWCETTDQLPLELDPLICNGTITIQGEHVCIIYATSKGAGLTRRNTHDNILYMLITIDAKCPERGWPFYVGQWMRFTITKQSIINAATLSFTPLLSSKRASGPVQYRTGNPRGGFPRVRELPDYDSSFQPAGAPISPKLAPTDTPGITRRLPFTQAVHYLINMGIYMSYIIKTTFI